MPRFCPFAFRYTVSFLRKHQIPVSEETFHLFHCWGQWLQAGRHSISEFCVMCAVQTLNRNGLLTAKETGEHVMCSLAGRVFLFWTVCALHLDFWAEQPLLTRVLSLWRKWICFLAVIWMGGTWMLILLSWCCRISPWRPTSLRFSPTMQWPPLRLALGMPHQNWQWCTIVWACLCRKYETVFVGIKIYAT